MPIMWCALIAMVLTAAPIETMHVKVATSVKDAATRRATLVVDVEPKPRMHVYAPGASGYRPVRLTIAAVPLVRALPLAPIGFGEDGRWTGRTRLQGCH